MISPLNQKAMLPVHQGSMFSSRQIYFIVFLAILQLFSEISYGKRINSYAGPYKVFVRNQPRTTGNKYPSSGKLGFHMFAQSPTGQGGPQFVYGESFNLVPIDDTLKLEARMSKWANNQWKENAFVMKFDKACSTLMIQSKTLAGILFGEDGKACPIKRSEKRIIENQTFFINFPQVPVFPYGRWLFILRFINITEPLGVLLVDAETLPKL